MTPVHFDLLQRGRVGPWPVGKKTVSTMSEPIDFEFERYLEDDEFRSIIEESLMYSREEQRIQHRGREEQPSVTESCRPTPANSCFVLAADFPYPSHLFRRPCMQLVTGSINANLGAEIAAVVERDRRMQVPIQEENQDASFLIVWNIL